MAARIETRAPIRHPLRAYWWALAIALFVGAAVWIWNMGGSSTPVKVPATAPVTTSVQRPANGLVGAGDETHPRPFVSGTVPAKADARETTITRGVATSPQQR